MSITTPPDLDHPVVAAVCAVQTLAGPLAEPDAGQLWKLNDVGLLEAYQQVQAAAAMVDALRLQVLGEIDRRRVTEHEFELLTPAWLRSTLSQSRRTATRDVILARALSGRFTTTARALAQGSVSTEQAEAIATTLDGLPDGLDGEQVVLAEATMLGYAGQYDPTALRTLSRHLLDVVAPEITEAADAERLERAERDARRTRCLSLSPDGHGSLLLCGKLPTIDGELLRTVVEAIAANDHTTDGEEPGGRKPAEQRRADALISILHTYQRVGAGPDHGGDRPRIVVQIPYQSLVHDLGSATLVETGAQISAGAARRLACDAGILPMVLGSPSQPLDLGREQRLFTGGLRQALIERDRGCVFPGCGRPPRDCDAHHLIPWWDGGTTSLDDGVLLCPHHHRVIEPDQRIPDHEQWHMRMGSHGFPDTIPPTHRDPERRPIRHHRHPRRQ